MADQCARCGLGPGGIRTPPSVHTPAPAPPPEPKTKKSKVSNKQSTTTQGAASKTGSDEFVMVKHPQSQKDTKKLYPQGGQCIRLAPIPYTFRVSAPGTPGAAQHAKSPPFYLQLDHAIAVLWCLFSPVKRLKKNLGIGQLQWAIYFLKAIKSPVTGGRAADVTIAIRAIEDALLECYADMSLVVMRPPSALARSCLTCELRRAVPRSACQVCSSTSLSFHGGRPRKSKTTMDDRSSPTTAQTVVLDELPCPKRSQLSQQRTDTSMQSSMQDEIRELRALAARLVAKKSGAQKSKQSPTTKDMMNDCVSRDTIHEMMYKFRQEQFAHVQDELRRLRSMDSLIDAEGNETIICSKNNSKSVLFSNTVQPQAACRR